MASVNKITIAGTLSCGHFLCYDDKINPCPPRVYLFLNLLTGPSKVGKGARVGGGGHTLSLFYSIFILYMVMRLSIFCYRAYKRSQRL